MGMVVQRVVDLAEGSSHRWRSALRRAVIHAIAIGLAS